MDRKGPWHSKFASFLPASFQICYPLGLVNTLYTPYACMLTGEIILPHAQKTKVFFPSCNVSAQLYFLKTDLVLVQWAVSSSWFPAFRPCPRPTGCMRRPIIVLFFSSYHKDATSFQLFSSLGCDGLNSWAAHSVEFFYVILWKELMWTLLSSCPTRCSMGGWHGKMRGVLG